MPVNKAAENALGTIGTIFWTIQLVPQIWKSYRTKSTEGLSHWLVLAWGLSGPFLGVYVIVQNLNIPLIVQPQLFATLCIISWAQCQYYGNKRPLKVCLLMLATLLAVSGGFEAGMVYAVKPAYNRGNMRPVQFFGIFSSVTISCALLPQYYEIWKHKEVIGISVLFMLVDCLGGVFSVLSLVFKEDFDTIAAVTYSLVVVLDGIVLLLALILNPMAKRRRAREAAAAADSTAIHAHSSESGIPSPVNEEFETTEINSATVQEEGTVTPAITESRRCSTCECDPCIRDPEKKEDRPVYTEEKNNYTDDHLLV
ncbi:PQ-loop-domain-containing protein [Abortiporus biennis]